MANYTKTFDLSVDDMELIEAALRTKITEKADALPKMEYQDLSQRVNGLLGRLHNQKTFYRPRNGTYVGG